MAAKLMRILAGVVVMGAIALAGAASAMAAQAPTLTGHWAFDEGSGATASDGSGGGHPLTLQGGAAWGPGVVGAQRALGRGLNGDQQYAQSAAPVIDTTQSFTVSAWVYLNNVNGYQTFVSQDGSQISGFFLQLRGDTHQFAFTRPAYDSPKALGIIATDTAVIPQPDEWYHLTGVYDASAQTISLYVNGQLAQTQSYVPNWSADGVLASAAGCSRATARTSSPAASTTSAPTPARWARERSRNSPVPDGSRSTPRSAGRRSTRPSSARSWRRSTTPPTAACTPS